MSIFTPGIIITLLISTAAQAAGTLLIPATHGLTKPLPTLGMLLSFGIGIGLLARLVGMGVNLSIAVPLVTTTLQLSSILFGIAVLRESASPLKILLLAGACTLVLVASYMR